MYKRYGLIGVRESIIDQYFTPKLQEDQKVITKYSESCKLDQIIGYEIINRYFRWKRMFPSENIDHAFTPEQWKLIAVFIRDNPVMQLAEEKGQNYEK